MAQSLYDRDFFAWATQQAALLRSGNVANADLEHIAEEIDSMGRAEKRELISRLAVLLVHLLKWQFQPALRGNSWRLSIEEQRRALARHLSDNPSLKSRLPEAVADAYGDALIATERETGLSRPTFPASCPYALDRMLDDDYWPE